MMAPTQSAHEAKFLFEVLGTSYPLSVKAFKLVESLSSPFELEVSLVSEEEINFDDVVGKESLLTLLGEDQDRYLHGILRQFMQNGSKGRFFLYEAVVVPSLWLLSLEQDCRIFQNKKVEDIIKQVLQDAGITSDRFDFSLQGKYPEREYCVQYRETDLDFISRLCEEEGIFYFFKHTKDKHLLIFGDSTIAYQPIKKEEVLELPYNPAPGMVPGREFVYEFVFSQRVYSGKITRRDFNFEKPTLDLTTKEQDKSYQKLEVYDYPGRYMEEGRGKSLTKVRLEESMTYKERAEAKSSCPRVVPGFKFKLVDHEREAFNNREYLFTEIRHEGFQPQVLEELADPKEKFSYHNQLIAIPASVVFRPERKTPKPVVRGIQTAVVVGPQGEEIYTDKYGRVKVQFHWDREGKKDEKSSCWIRVGQFWAGNGWGVVFIPRIGDEVIVDFLEGDPDKPLIVGSVYNGDNLPLYNLPDEKTKSTIKTKSTPNDTGYNEIRFEDKKGEEEIFIHAQKDMNEKIENDMSTSVGGNRSINVSGTHTETIKKDTKITISEGKYEHIVAANTASYEVKGAVTEKFLASQDTKVTGMITISSGKGIEVTATNHIQLKSGASTLFMSSDGTIKISGKSITLIGDADIKTSAPKVETSGKQEVKIGVGNSVTKFDPTGVTTSGAKINTSATGIHEIKGGIVKIN